MPDQPAPQTPPGQQRDSSTGRDRLVEALRRPSKGQISAAVLLGVLGFAGVVQVQANNEDDRYTGASQQDLIQLINAQELDTQRVEEQIRSLETTRDALRSDTAASELALEVARRQAVSLSILAGTVPVVGRGVQVTVDGPPEAIGTEELVNCIQELRDAGAEAIQLNQAVRLVGSSAISDGPGDSVVVDGQAIQPPFVIDAIGNPEGLRKGLTIVQGFEDDIEAAGGVVRFRDRERLEITTTRALTSPRYAVPND